MDMDIEQNILYYLKICNGSYKRTTNSILQEAINLNLSDNENNRIRNDLPYAFDRLERRKLIEIIPFSKLTPMQQGDVNYGDRYYKIKKE